MTEMAVCPRCGARLTAEQARDATCPRCVLGLALEAGRDGPAAPENPPESPGLLDLDPASVAGDPTSIGPYRIVRRLGSGGMGVVYLTEQTEPIRRQVALKVIRKGLDTTTVMRRFEAERQALALMDHPAIARVLDAGETAEGRPYFVMEYVPGEPVTHYCDRKRLTTRARLDLFSSICDGVQHAHRKGVIHRDLKPSNILVAEEGDAPKPKIIDFGIAKAIDRPLTERALFTEMGVIVGTPEYMSPEQAALSAIEVDTRTDVYSLGVLLYELLVGALPFAAEELRAAGFDEMRRRIREEEPPTPSTRLSTLGARSTDAARERQTDPAALRRQIQGELDWITLKALEKDPGRRYESPSDLAADVRRHLADEPVEASPAGTVYRLGKFVRRNKVMVGSLAMVSAALVAGTVVATAFGLREATQRRRADEALRDLEKVTEFQAEMLADVNAEEMGRRMVADLRARGLEAQGKVGVGESAAAADVAAFDRFAGRINATDAALRAIDEEILARAAEAMEEPFADQPLVRARLAHTIGLTYMELGLLERAGPHVKRAVEIREHELGRDHPDTLSSIDREASFYLRQGLYDKAEPLYLESLEASQRTLGPEHPQTLLSMNNLAILYSDRGRNAEAEKLHAEVVSIRHRSLGAEHQDTLTSMNDLAENYRQQGRFDEAERLYGKVLEGRRKTLGDEHLHTLLTMSNLANHYASRGRSDLAEPLAKEVLETRRRVLGDEHPDTLRSLGVLASVRLEQGRLVEAEALYAEGIEIASRALGRDHPSTLVTMNNLARVYASHGRLEEAIRLDTEILEARGRVLGSDHPDTLGSMSNLALNYSEVGRKEEAVRLNLDVIERRRRVLGPDHPYTLLSLSNLALLYQSLGRMDDAEGLLREAYEAARRKFGLDDRRTILPMGNLAELRLARGDAAEAERLLSEAAGAVRIALPAGHFTTGVTLRKYGASLTALGRRAEAEPVLLEAYEIVAKAAGAEHHQTRKVARDLAALYEAWGQPEKAAPWRAKAPPADGPR
jgi:non-specific serine/threonine protein kinase/serine/threonine-protein kinase